MANDIFALDTAVTPPKAGVSKWVGGRRDAFAESLRGTVNGITRLSPNVRGLIAGVVMVVVGLFAWAIMSIEDKGPRNAQDAGAKDERVVATGPAIMPVELTAGINNGRAMPTPPEAPVVEHVPTAGKAADTSVPALGRGPALPTSAPVGGAPARATGPDPLFKDASVPRVDRGAGPARGWGADGVAGAAGVIPGIDSIRQAADAARADAAQRAAAMVAGAQPGAGSALNPALAQGAATDQNLQLRKEAFILRAMQEEDDSVLKSARRRPLTNYVVSTGSIIPCMMLAGTNSDLPGMVRGVVTENVHDSLTRRHILVPQGTVVTGYYDSQVAFGQRRLLVVWNLMTFPDTSTMALKGMPAGDETGAAGLTGDVDNHWMKIFGGAVASSIIAGAFQVSQAPPTTINGQTAPPTIGQTMASALGQQLGAAGSAISQKNMAIQPTITAPVGQRFVINVTKTIVFEKPYS